MPTNYPTSLDTTTQLPVTRSDATAMATNHSADHDNVNAAAVAIETKIGTGSSTPTSGTVLTGTGTGTSAWQAPTGGSGTLVVAAKSANYTLTDADDVINATGGAGGITITLHSAATAAKKAYRVKKVDSGAGAVTIGGTVDGVASPTLALQYDAIVLIPDGSAWLAF